MKIVFVAIFALLSSVCLGNTQNLDLLSGNPQWMYSTYMNGALIGAEPNVMIDDERFGLLEKNGMTYHLLYQIDRLDTDNGDVLFVPFEPLGVREKDGKVYVLSDDLRKQVARLSQYDMDEVQMPYLQSSESELLLYDFTLEEGDQYPTSSAYDAIFVEKVENIVTDDAKNRKLFTLTNGLQLMEGIGCLNSRNGDFLYYLYPPEVWKHNNDFFYNRLYEYKKNGIVVYKEYDGLTNGISGISVRTETRIMDKDEYYDLQGRRLSGKPAKGVYIENGRKRVVK